MLATRARQVQFTIQNANDRGNQIPHRDFPQAACKTLLYGTNAHNQDGTPVGIKIGILNHPLV